MLINLLIERLFEIDTMCHLFTFGFLKLAFMIGVRRSALIGSRRGCSEMSSGLAELLHERRYEEVEESILTLAEVYDVPVADLADKDVFRKRAHRIYREDKATFKFRNGRTATSRPALHDSLSYLDLLFIDTASSTAQKTGRSNQRSSWRSADSRAKFHQGFI